MAFSGSDYTDITCVASTGLTGNQYYVVRSSGVDTANSAGNLTALLCLSSTGGVNGAKGVLQNDPDTGQAAIVRVSGLTKLAASAAIAVGDAVGCSTDGRGVTVSTTGTYAFGKAESASTAAGQIISVRLFGALVPQVLSTA